MKSEINPQLQKIFENHYLPGANVWVSRKLKALTPPNEFKGNDNIYKD